MTKFVLPLFFLLICGIVWWSIVRLNELSRSEISSVLQTISSMTRDGVKTWEEETRTDVAFWAQQPAVKNATADLLKSAPLAEELRRQPALAALRQELLPALKESGYIDFAIIAPNGTELASLNDSGLGRKDLYNLEHPAIAAALSGRNAISPTFEFHGTSPRTGGVNANPVPSLLAVAPMYDDLQHVIAVFAFELDAAHEFNVITKPARMNQSGETYLIDRRGRILTESRFVSYHGGELDVRDPNATRQTSEQEFTGRNALPLTKAAQAVLEGEAGSDLDGYNDYRGVKVVGSWIYVPELQLGVITEMDKNEAYARYYMSRRITIFLFVTTVAGLLVLGIFRARIARQRGVAEAREELLAVVAHDLRNPLQSIAINSALLLKLIDVGEIGLRARKCANAIQHGSQRLKVLVDDLLQAAQIEAGKLTVALKRQNLPPIFESAAAVLEPLAREAELQFAVHLAPDLPEASVDSARLIQVLSNLVGNAIKFTPAGGSIEIGVNRAGDFVQIEVSDSGSGIDPQNLPHLFKRYWQGGSGAHKGAGLGLFIVKGIVEAHGGRIWVESQPGNGTHFFFTVPVAH